MQQGQDFRRFGYKPLSGTPVKNPRASEADYFDPQNSNTFLQRISGGIMAGFTHSPLLSTVGVLMAGAAFAFAIYSFYPSSDSESGAVPIIKAEATQIKMAPTDAGGMDIPFQDSTIYGSPRTAYKSGGRIENLLDQPANQEDVTLDKDALLAQQDSEMNNITESPAFSAQAKTAEAAPSEENLISPAQQQNSTSRPSDLENLVAEDADSAAASQSADLAIENAASVNAANTTTTPAAAPVTPVEQAPGMNEPGQSPETLAFVRSVLEKKDAQAGAAATTEQEAPVEQPAEPAAASSVTAEAPASVESVPETIEPASGVEGNYTGSKTHYVQLASISERGRADAEWAKLKSSMSAIPGSSGYRVQEANLDKGMFYRIQAGPYTEAQAKDICDAIKTQKPGGCFVVR